VIPADNSFYAGFRRFQVFCVWVTPWFVWFAVVCRPEGYVRLTLAAIGSWMMIVTNMLMIGGEKGRCDGSQD